MASGYSWGGGRSRCFAFWQEFSKCYAAADVPAECTGQATDYLECLHHTKEIARAKAIQAELLKRAKHEATENQKVADILKEGGGGIAGMGLITKQPSSPGDGEKETSPGNKTQ